MIIDLALGEEQVCAGLKWTKRILIRQTESAGTYSRPAVAGVGQAVRCRPARPSRRGEEDEAEIPPRSGKERSSQAL
jgi:hypothetical protein